MRIPLVEIEWTDTTFVSGWKTLKEHQNEKPNLCRTVGNLIRVSRHSLHVVATQDDQGNVADQTIIPRRCVRRMRRIPRLWKR